MFEDSLSLLKRFFLSNVSVFALHTEQRTNEEAICFVSVIVLYLLWVFHREHEFSRVVLALFTAVVCVSRKIILCDVTYCRRVAVGPPYWTRTKGQSLIQRIIVESPSQDFCVFVFTVFSLKRY